ncbi:MAG: type II toxin-antitoxin system ParD family antitoxin [Azospirillaceae bacterium]|nr:type II toxin-antitoxin system ParD family antitoxin [Azospirillaceae bacterium]
MPSSVSLGPQLEGIVDQLVSSGRYNSRSEVLRDGVRLLHERELKLAALDAALQRGLDDADAGDVLPAETVFDELLAKLARTKAGGSKA